MSIASDRSRRDALLGLGTAVGVGALCLAYGWWSAEPPAATPTEQAAAASHTLPTAPSAARDERAAPAAPPASDVSIHGIVLISMDTTRADHLSCYGFTKPTTPQIDRWAQSATRFEVAYAPAPLTLPSHATMLTGLDPPGHGIHMNGEVLGESHTTLAEVLQAQGFATGAVVGSFVLDSQFGLARGFDHYHDQFDRRIGQTGISERSADEVTRYARTWLSEHHEQPYFLFVHYFDPHQAYAPPEPFASQFDDDLYAGEIAYTDAAIGKLLDTLDALNTADRTLVILTADHGEMLGEHGEATHTFFIYRNAVRVPLIIRMPGQRAGATVAGAHGVVDIVPTLCGLLGCTAPPACDGRDASDELRRPSTATADADERMLYCESYTANHLYKASVLTSLIGRRWQFIETTRDELYDLEQDPAESQNRLTELPRQVAAWREALAESGSRDTVLEPAARDGQALRQLEGLGYVAGRATRSASGVQEGEDPKDLIAYHAQFTDVAGFKGQGDYASAKAVCAQLVGLRRDLPAAHLELARIAVLENEPQQAFTHARRVLELDEENADAHFICGDVLQSQGEYASATRHLRRALALKPHDAQIPFKLGVAFQAQQRIGEAVRYYRAALRIDPDSYESHNNLAVILIRQGELAEGAEHLRAALASKPDHPSARQNLKAVEQLLKARASDAAE